ncbi:MAG: lipocalin family protein [Capsulimonadaceae bacterium]|nr:lipocalin family protein [Capsulimonadaceae bacterium]
MPRSAVRLFLLLIALVVCAAQVFAAPFPVDPHDNVMIEWWYLNAHVTTDHARHLAVIGSFFRINAGADPDKPSRGHYLIWAVTDEDQGSHQTYSLGDRGALRLLQQYATLKMLQNPDDIEAGKLFDAVSRGKFPGPTQILPGTSSVTGNPFSIHFGPDDSLLPSVPAYDGPVEQAPSAFSLKLAAPSGPEPKVDLVFQSAKPPMLVGGNGNTGLFRPEDMKYVSLTRCNVVGTIDDGNGPEKIASGQGWIDHQWGDTWTTQSNGWDWWGIQLADGRDLLIFRHRDLATGRIFFPLATIMDASGQLTVERNLVFTENRATLWTSPRTKITYPLDWTIGMPDQNLTLSITTSVRDQEMAVITGGTAIWEGTCQATAQTSGQASVPGVAYMELVGYNSQAVRKMLMNGEKPETR